ncbi:MAG: hypothetical protein AB1529_03875 [Candidatus Micrarchaeota archaeon]
MSQLHHARHAPSIPPAITLAQGRFGRYKKDNAQPIRQAETSGDELQELRQLREMLRSMTPEQAIQVIEFRRGLNAFEALAKREGALIVPNFVHDRILTETDYAFLSKNYPLYPVWTGTAVLYKPGGKPFGKRFVFSWREDDARYSVSYNVPHRFQGRKDCVLVVEHPDFELVPIGNNRFKFIASPDSVHLLDDFPPKPVPIGSLHYFPFDERFRIPAGTETSLSAYSRCLSRQNGGYIGLIARRYAGRDQSTVGLGLEPSSECGVALARLK